MLYQLNSSLLSGGRSRILMGVLALIGVICSVFVLDKEEAKASNSAVQIAVLGDGYASGVGAGQYFGAAGCYRSYNSFAEEYAQIMGRNGIPSGVVINKACDGATTADVIDQAMLMSANDRDSRDLVFVSVGAHDFGMEDVIRLCTFGTEQDIAAITALASMIEALDISLEFSLSTLEQNCSGHLPWVDSKRAETLSRTKNVLNQLASTFKNARIVLVGYPHITSFRCNYRSLGDVKVIEDARAMIDRFSSGQRDVVSSLASQHPGRFHYAPLTGKYYEHELCGNLDDWIHSWKRGSNAERYRPNETGQLKTAEFLWGRDIHKGLPYPVSTQPAPSPTTTSPVNPNPSGYTNLPLECGASVPYVSTYDSFTLGGKTYYHGHALDFPAASGTGVAAPASGKVDVRYSSGYGNYIDLTDSSGKVHRLAHLQSNGLIADGAYVTKSKVIGKVGSTGASTGAHLHYEQRVGGYQVPVVLEGPGLNWGARFTSGGDRHTTHSVTSANCSNGSTAGPSQNSEDETYLIQFNNTGSGRIEFHGMNHNQQKWDSHIATNHRSVEKGNFRVAAGDTDGDGLDEIHLVIFNNTGSGKIEVHAWNQALKKWTRHIATNHPSISHKRADILFADRNGDGRDEPYLILYNNTGSGRIEIHGWSHDFKKWVLHKAIPQGQVPRANHRIIFGDPNGDGKDNAFFVVYQGTATGKVEIHRLSDNLSKWTLHKALPHGPLTTFRHDFQFTDLDGDRADRLTLIKYNRTGSGRVELHVLNREYSKWILHRATLQSAMTKTRNSILIANRL